MEGTTSQQSIIDDDVSLLRKRYIPSNEKEVRSTAQELMCFITVQSTGKTVTFTEASFHRNTSPVAFWVQSKVESHHRRSDVQGLGRNIKCSYNMRMRGRQRWNERK